MKSICRLCCTYSDIAEMRNLFDDESKHLLEKLKYFACFTFPIDVNDGFPPYICIRCTKLLRSAYDFKMICESAEANFWALSQSNIDVMPMEIKYQIELVDYERDCALEHLEENIKTETTTANDVSEPKMLFPDEQSDDEKPDKSDLITHTKATSEIRQSTTSLYIEKRKICTKMTGSTCDICGELFRRKRDLVRHIKLAHHPRQKTVPEKSWICESCGKNFRSQYSLKYHINGTHVDTVEKNYSCNLCDFKCRLARYLVSHELKHTGAKPHACKECGLTFGFAGSLNRHIQAVHRHERRHKCTICDRNFKTKFRLKEHMNTHTGQDPYECPHCPSRYRYKNSLKRHVRKGHGLTNWKNSLYTENDRA